VDRIPALFNAHEAPGPLGFSDPRFDRFVITSHHPMRQNLAPMLFDEPDPAARDAQRTLR
jgi:hypothetical protein